MDDVFARMVSEIRDDGPPTDTIPFHKAAAEIALALRIPDEAAGMVLYGLCVTTNVRFLDGQRNLVDFEECTVDGFWHKTQRVSASEVRFHLKEWSSVPQSDDAKKAAIRSMLKEGKVPPRLISWKLFRNEVRDRCNGWLAPGKPAFGFGDKQIDRITKDIMNE